MLHIMERFIKDDIDFYWYPSFYWISWAFLLCNFTISGPSKVMVRGLAEIFRNCFPTWSRCHSHTDAVLLLCPMTKVYQHETSFFCQWFVGVLSLVTEVYGALDFVLPAFGTQLVWPTPPIHLTSKHVRLNKLDGCACPTLRYMDLKKVGHQRMNNAILGS